LAAESRALKKIEWRWKLPPKKRSVSECLQLAFWADQRRVRAKSRAQPKKKSQTAYDRRDSALSASAQN